MRILHVVATGQRRGAEMFAADLIAALNESGVEQRVAVLRPSEDVAVHYEAASADLGSRGRMLPALRVYPRTVRALSRLLGDWSPDVLQAHGGETLKYAALAGSGRGTALVYRRIGTAPPWIRRGLRRAAHGRLMRRADRVITVADAVHRETVERFRVPPSRIITIPNGVDPQRVRATAGSAEIRRRLRIPLGAPLLVSLGAMTWEKDPLAQLDVMTRLRVHDAHLVMFGDGPLRSAVAAAIPRRGLEERVRLLEATERVADVLAASDALLLTSRTEGMPAIAIEAGMAGRPVAAYAVAGVPEVVEDGVTGVLVQPGVVDALADRLTTLLQDTEGRRAMGEAAAASCIARFDIRAIAPRYLAVYEQVAAHRGPVGTASG